MSIRGAYFVALSGVNPPFIAKNLAENSENKAGRVARGWCVHSGIGPTVEF